MTPPRPTPRIFISYRRDDAAGDAGRLADHLNRRFGAGGVFLDIETIDPGTDFVTVLQTTLQQTAAVLVVIGPRWISLRGADGRRRLDDEKDFVRLEVEKALGRGIPVVPVLVQGTPLPRAEELPASIAALATRQTAVLDHAEFHADAERLCDRLEAMLGGRKGRQSGWRRWGPLVAGVSVLLIAWAIVATLGTSTPETPAASDGSGATGTPDSDRARAGEVRSLIVQADAQRRRAQFADALATLAAARQVAPASADVRRAQEDVAMEWVRGARLESREATYGDTIKPALMVIDASLATATGERRADLLAHSGWATFLMWRDGNPQLDPVEWYQQAIALDPANPYANAMLAHWILFREDEVPRAAQLFAVALRSGRAVEAVRDLQWAALGNRRTPQADVERVRVADAMRRESRPLSERQTSALWAPYYFTLSGHEQEQQMLLAAVSPDDHISTLKWAFSDYAADDESRQQTIRYYVALLNAAAGRTDEAIEDLRTLNNEVAGNDGPFRNAVRAALKQLQGTPPRRMPR